MIQPFHAPAPRPRPARVTVAFAFQIALAGLMLVVGGLIVADTIRYDAVIDEAARLAGGGADAVTEHQANWSGALTAVVPMVLLAVWFGVTSLWVRRGSNVGRILTLVGLGLPFVLGVGGCLLGGLAGAVAFGLMPPDDYSAGPDESGFDGQADFYDQLDRLDGAGNVALDVLTTAASGAALLLGIAAGVLLLTGPAHRYFRPQPPYLPYQPYGYGFAPPGFAPPGFAAPGLATPGVPTPAVPPTGGYAPAPAAPWPPAPGSRVPPAPAQTTEASGATPPPMTEASGRPQAPPGTPPPPAG